MKAVGLGGDAINGGEVSESATQSKSVGEVVTTAIARSRDGCDEVVKKCRLKWHLQLRIQRRSFEVTQRKSDD